MRPMVSGHRNANLKVGPNMANDDSATIPVEAVVEGAAECTLAFPRSLELICCVRQRECERRDQQHKKIAQRKMRIGID